MTRLRAGRPGFNSRQRHGLFVFSGSGVRPAIHLLPGILSPMIKRLGCKVEHSFPSTAEVKSECSYTSILPYVFKKLCLIIKQRDNFNLIYIFRVTENRVLTKIFEPKKQEVTEEWKKLHDRELYNLYSSRIEYS
jgi:hypothetical protein